MLRINVFVHDVIAIGARKFRGFPSGVKFSTLPIVRIAGNVGGAFETNETRCTRIVIVGRKNAPSRNPSRTSGARGFFLGRFFYSRPSPALGDRPRPVYDTDTKNANDSRIVAYSLRHDSRVESTPSSYVFCSGPPVP